MRMLIVAGLLFLAACGGRVEDVGPVVTRPDDSAESSPEPSSTIANGTFAPAAHDGEGYVEIVERNDRHFVSFREFGTDRGPDLKVYLSKDIDATRYVDLGRLQRVSGPQTYLVPEGVDPRDYGHVLVWCESFSVLFTSAPISFSTS